MTLSKLLPFIFFIGFVCIGIGLYSVLNTNNQLPTQAVPQPSTIATQDTSMPVRVAVPANVMWVDTGVNLAAGQNFSLHAEGSWRWDTTPEHVCGAEGFGRHPGLMVPDAPLAGLIGRIGSSSFFASRSYYGTAPVSGTLYLSLNDLPKLDAFTDNVGTLYVTIEKK